MSIQNQKNTWLILLFLSIHITINAQSLELIKSVDSTSIQTGIKLTYTLQFRCASITSNCENVIIRDTIPAGLDFVDFTDSPIFSSNTSFDNATGIITFELNKQTGTGMLAGSTGEVRFRAEFPNGATPNNFIAENRAVMTSDNSIDYVSNAVNTTATAQSTWAIDKTNANGNNIYVDNDFTYRIRLDDVTNGAAGSLNLDTLTIIDQLPVGAVFVSANNGGVYDSGNHEVVWALDGRTINDDWTIQVTVNYPDATFDTGDPVDNVVELYGQPVGEPYGLLDTDNQAGVIAAPNPVGNISKSSNNDAPVIGDTIFYYIDAQNIGSTALDNFFFVDTLPPQVELIQIETGRYNQAANLTISYQTNLQTTYQTIAGSPFDGANDEEILVSSLGLAANEYVTILRYDYGNVAIGFAPTTDAEFHAYVIDPDHDGNAVPTGFTITNCAYLNYDYEAATTTDQDCTDGVVREVVPPSVVMDKDDDRGNVPIGAELNYLMLPSLVGDTPMDSIVMIDTIPVEMNLVRTESGGWNNLNGNVEVYYQTNNNSNFQTWVNSPYAPTADAQLLVTDLNLATNEYVTIIKWVFKNPQVGFAHNGNRPRVRGDVLEIDRNGNPVMVGGTVDNCAYLTGYINGTTYLHSDCDGPNILPRIVDGDPDKDIVDNGNEVKSAGPFFPGDIVEYIILAKSDESSSDTLINPIIVDLLPAQLSYVPDSWQIVSNPDNLPVPNFEEIQNYNNTGRTLLRWSWTGVASADFLSNDQIEISFQTIVGVDVQAEQIIENTAYQTTNDVPTYGCDEAGDTDTNDLDGDGITTDIICSDNVSTSFDIQSVASLISEKLVKGQLDSTYSKFPDFGNTIPGGDVDYQLFVRNQGTVPMTNLIVIDILPFVGDKGVIDPQDRLSRWRPNLASTLSVPAGVTVYYSTEENPCRSAEGIVPSGPAGCVNPNWSTTPPAQLADVQSFKLEFGERVVNPGDELKVEWKMKAPINTLDNIGNISDTIAWNSFAFVADKINPDGSVGDALLAAEPIKVGIRLQEPEPGSYGNFVFYDTNQDGIQDAGEIGVDNVRVDFYVDNGDGIADPSVDSLVSFTITTDGGLYLFPELEEGDYFAVFQKPATYIISPRDVGANDNVDSDGLDTLINNTAVAITPVTNIGVDEDDLSWDLGIFQNNLAAVGNYVWHDVNQDGLQNESATLGVNGIEVRLFDTNDQLLKTTFTANDAFGNPGYYLFDSLPPASYYLEFQVPTSFNITTPDQLGTGSDAGDSDVMLTADTTIAKTENFTLVANQYDPNWDAGLILPTGVMSLGNFVWIDNDNNGNFNPATESGINDVVVNLYEDSNNDGTFTPNVDAFLATTTTQTSGGKLGYYLFENLAPGDYIVQIDDSNFSANGLLNNHTSSTGNGIAADPDDDLNFDDNGEPLTDYGVVSQAITLVFNEEPINDEDTNNNSNLTVDFGFFPGTPCEVILGNVNVSNCNENGGSPTINLNVDIAWFNAPDPAENLEINLDGNPQTPVSIMAGTSGSQTYTLSTAADGRSGTFAVAFATTSGCGSTIPYTVPNGCPLQMVKTADKYKAAVGDTVTYTYQITNNAADTVSLSNITDDKIGTIATFASNNRVTNNLQALYLPGSDSGTTITDVSDVGAPLNLTIENNNFAFGNDHVEFTNSNRASNHVDNNKIYTASSASNAITVEAWITPSALSQNGPARIVTLSNDGSNRNFSLMQNGSSGYQVRLRTSTSNNNGNSVTLNGGTINTTGLTHVVFTRDAAGQGYLYYNGVEVDDETFGGDFSTWDATYGLAIGHELSVGNTETNRDWQGKFYTVAIYSEALSAAEVQQNYAEGVVSLSTPTVIAPNETASFTATYEITAADLPGPVLNTADVVGFYPNGDAIPAQDTAAVKIGCTNLSITQFDLQNCNDNATGNNSNDDYYTIEVNATHTTGTQYEVVLNHGEANEQILATANYGTATIIGNSQELTADGVSIYQITIRDATDNSCFEMIETTPVASCSSCPSEICLPIGVTVKKSTE